MKRRSWVIVIAIVAILLIYTIITYNSLIKADELVNQDWSEVQNTYQRRIDLIPNLVTVVKGVSDFEQTTQVQVAEARNKAASVSMPADVNAENYERQKTLQDSLAASVNRLIVRIEAYPELRGTSAYLGLQKQLEGTERRIVIARRDFNKSVNNYNNKVRGFPGNLVAGLLGFRTYKGFEGDEGSEKRVEIKFN